MVRKYLISAIFNNVNEYKEISIMRKREKIHSRNMSPMPDVLVGSSHKWAKYYFTVADKTK